MNLDDLITQVKGLSPRAVAAHLEDSGANLDELREAVAERIAQVKANVETDRTITADVAKTLASIRDATATPADQGDGDGDLENDGAEEPDNNNDGGGGETPADATDNPPVTEEGDTVANTETDTTTENGTTAVEGELLGAASGQNFARQGEKKIFTARAGFIPRGRPEQFAMARHQAFATGNDQAARRLTSREEFGRHVTDQVKSLRNTRGSAKANIVEFRMDENMGGPRIDRRMSDPDREEAFRKAADASLARWQFEADMSRKLRFATARGYDDVQAVLAEQESGRAEFANVGWCSPSVDVYEFCGIPAAWGLFDELIPSVTFERGGVRYPVVPPLSDLWFEQMSPDTAGIACETEAEWQDAPDDFVKPCVTLGCPEWVENRENVCHLCLVSSIFMNRTFPEWVANEIARYMLIYRYWMNWQMLQTAIQAAVDMTGDLDYTAQTEGWSAMSAVSQYVQFVVEELSTRNFLDPDTYIFHVALPHWLKPLLRADLEKRSNADLGLVTDSQINDRITGTRDNIRVHWLSMWQTYLTEDVEDPEDRTWFGSDASLQSGNYPTTAQILVWPEGAWIGGQEDIITMRGHYDYNLLRTNHRLELFTEQAWMLVPRCYEAAVFSISTCPNGRVGLPVEYECPTDPVLPEPVAPAALASA